MLTSPNRYIKENEILENEYVSFKAPNTNWETAKDYKTANYTKDRIYLDNYTPKGATFTITIHTDPEIHSDIMTFKKNFNYEESFKKSYSAQETKDSHKEQGIYYAYSQTQYIKGMKCYVYVRAGENILKQNGNTIKSYDTWCGYYDKNNEKRRLRISYDLQYYPGNIRLEKDKNTPTNQIIPRDKMELKLKQQVKKLIDTLKIKNFDKQKMIKEGLYHPNKKYEHMKW